MTTLTNLIQLYPAFNKLIADLTGYWTGADPAAKERIFQHKLDTLTELLRAQQLITRAPHCDASTQTEEVPCESNFFPPR